MLGPDDLDGHLLILEAPWLAHFRRNFISSNAVAAAQEETQSSIRSLSRNWPGMAESASGLSKLA